MPNYFDYNIDRSIQASSSIIAKCWTIPSNTISRRCGHEGTIGEIISWSTKETINQRLFDTGLLVYCISSMSSFMSPHSH